MNDKTYAARGILAGICVSFGGCIFLRVGGVTGSVLFSFGLITVVTLGLNLFTGKSQFVWGRAPEGQWREGGYLWLLGILLLNIAGCAIGAMLFSSPAMQEAAGAILDKRLATHPLRNCLLSMGCGFIMTLAVQSAAKGKWLPLLFGIPAFILCGLPHCVADAFYIASLSPAYMAENLASLIVFYIVIVIGNFIGCNSYRLLGRR